MSNFTVIDSGLSHNKASYNIVESVDEFMQKTLQNPKLIYGTEEQYDAFLSEYQVGDTQIRKNVRNTEFIKNIPANNVLFVTDPELMRSFDYGHRPG